MKLILSVFFILASWVLAEEPKMEMHRVQDVTKDGSGWYFGKSTKGSFSVLLPIPFNDFTITAIDPNIGEIITHGIGSKSSEGVKFTVSEMVRTKRTKDPKLESTVVQFESPKSQVLEINYANYLDFPSVTFSVSQDTSGAFVRFIKTPKSLITMILEYPKAQAGLAVEKRATFLDSLRITEQGGAGQPATRPESYSEGSDKPQPSSEGRSR